MSSCKKQVPALSFSKSSEKKQESGLLDFSSDVGSEFSSNFSRDIIEQKAGEQEDIFSPVSVREAKQFAFSQNISRRKSQKNFKGSSVRPNMGSSNMCASFICVKDIQVKDFAEFVRQKEAKLSDVPIPLNAEPIQRYFQELPVQNKIVLGYKMGLKDLKNKELSNIDNLVIFYTQEMERLGWKSVAFFDGFEKLMVFKKPSRFCTVSIRAICPVGESAGENRAKIVICVQV